MRFVKFLLVRYIRNLPASQEQQSSDDDSQAAAPQQVPRQMQRPQSRLAGTLSAVTSTPPAQISSLGLQYEPPPPGPHPASALAPDFERAFSLPGMNMPLPAHFFQAVLVAYCHKCLLAAQFCVQSHMNNAQAFDEDQSQRCRWLQS